MSERLQREVDGVMGASRKVRPDRPDFRAMPRVFAAERTDSSCAFDTLRAPMMLTLVSYVRRSVTGSNMTQASGRCAIKKG